MLTCFTVETLRKLTSTMSSKQQKLTSFFVQSKKKQSNKVDDNDKPKLSKNERLRELLNDMKAKQGNKNPGHSDINPSIPFYAPILDQISEQRKEERKRLIKSNQKYSSSSMGIQLINGQNQNYFHGPTYGDHTDSKASWKGYFEHRNKKMRKQFKNTDRSIYGDLSSNGIHFNKTEYLKNKANPQKKLNVNNKNDKKRERSESSSKNNEPSPKKRKLMDNDSKENQYDDEDEDEEEEIDGIFNGVTVYFNGRTNDLSSFHLNKVLIMNGGNFSVNPNSKVTHIVTTNLSRSKINRAINKMGKFKSHQVYYVKSEWITDSVRNGKLMDENDYLVFKSTKHGKDISNYFNKK